MPDDQPSPQDAHAAAFNQAVPDLVTMTLDHEVCIGIGQCELLEPDAFRFDDDQGCSVLIGDHRLERSRAELVVDKCPSRAIGFAE